MEFYGNFSISGVYKRHFNLELIKVIYYFDLGEIYKGFSIGGVVNKLMNILLCWLYRELVSNHCFKKLVLCTFAEMFEHFIFSKVIKKENRCLAQQNMY